ncbi:F-box protein PP2-B10 [Linum perenne]
MEELPENCIVKVLSFAGPQESCKLALISNIFRSASQFDGLWESFLPPDYQTLIPQSSNPSLLSDSPSKRQLVITLCDHPILIRNATMSLGLDKGSGKTTVMIGPTELAITWGDNPRYWQWRGDSDSRFDLVAELRDVCWFEISARVEMMSSRLSPKSKYAAYFVFKMSSDASGFENRRVDAEVRVGGTGVVNEGGVYLHGGGGGGVPRKRGDEWYEVKMGEFWTPEQDQSESDCLELKLLNRSGHWKKGVIVHGIEFRSA